MPTIPGLIMAHGSFRAPDKISSTTFEVVARFDGKTTTGQFFVFNYGNGLPVLGINPGVVDAIAVTPDGMHATVEGHGTMNGMHALVELHLSKGVPCMAAVRVTCGVLVFESPGYPLEKPEYSGSIILQKPFSY